MPAVLLLHGVHPQGIDESHLVAFARVLAAGGLDVLTPELPALVRFHVNADTVAQIEHLAQAHAQQIGVGRVGVIGVSFAGGLALMAAAAAAEQQRAAVIGFVVAIGAHHDLLRLASYYAGQDVRGPHGERVPVAPHPYGARVMLYEQLERLFASADLPVARLALETYLNDRPRQAREFARRLSPEAKATMAVLLEQGKPSALAALLMRAAEASGPVLRAASPRDHLRELAVPVLLIHGADDPVIPAIETRYLAREVPARWLRQSLITPLLRHTDFPSAPRPREIWQLVRFLRAIYESAFSMSY